MFRKREDSLFDNSIDPNAAQAVETVTPVTPQATVAQPVTAQAPAPISSINRPFPESRQAPVSQPTNVFRPASAPAPVSAVRAPEIKVPVTTTSTLPASLNPSNKSGRRVLTVGHDILLKGEIATCDRLVIEGKVDATLNDVHTVEIAESGSFKGSAHIEDAEISGLFEGDLTVRGCLIIRSTGKVRGKISFGEIEIERGGELAGEIKIAGVQDARPVRPATPTKESVAA